MASYVLYDEESLKYLKKADAWGYTLTQDLQEARIYINKNAAHRTMNNKPSYAKGDKPNFMLKEIKISLAE